jgi:hypothetical protein
MADDIIVGHDLPDGEDEHDPAASADQMIDADLLQPQGVFPASDDPSPSPILAPGKGLRAIRRDKSIRSLVKRPRGRPPLIQSNRNTSNDAIGRTRPFNNSSSVLKLPPTIPVKAAVSSSHSKLQLVNMLTTSSSPAAYDPSSYHEELPRPSYEEVVHKLLPFLMISEPVTASDLFEEFCEVPEDMIVGVLDVLSTLGIVIQAHSRDVPTVGVQEMDVYALADFNKFSTELLSYQQITQETAQKLEELRLVKGRIRELHELTSLELTPEDRSRRLSDLLQAFAKADPELRTDSLYDELFKYFEQPSTDSI